MFTRSHSLCALLLVGGAAIFSAQPAEPKPTWHEDWASAHRVARKENKPIFAVLVCRH